MGCWAWVSPKQMSSWRNWKCSIEESLIPSYGQRPHETTFHINWCVECRILSSLALIRRLLGLPVRSSFHKQHFSRLLLKALRECANKLSSWRRKLVLLRKKSGKIFSWSPKLSSVGSMKWKKQRAKEFRSGLLACSDSLKKTRSSPGWTKKHWRACLYHLRNTSILDPGD